MLKKRFFSYVFDLFILGVFLFLLIFILPKSHNLVVLYNEMLEIISRYNNGGISFDLFINQYAYIFYNMMRELFLFILIYIFINILYCVVYPSYHEGKTFGKKIFGLKVATVDDMDVSCNHLLIRYLFMNNIGIMILFLCFILFMNDFNYFLCFMLLMFLQFIVVISSVFMVIYRRDKRSLPDLFAGTKVIEVKE
jgi:uncharacterized RDD family membrane protein YckC